MKTIKKNILSRLGSGAFLALASLTFIITFGTVTPAHTKDHYERGHERRWEGERNWDNGERYERNREMEWREREGHARHWRHEHRYRYYDEPRVYYGPPPVYYGPPPVYYDPPPPPPPGINIIVPLRFK
ncbi:hypothetical protein FCL47_21355 [Desulfopila sp. IMCC35006]|nr:hypothetical protein FCL47_21355 [Desulfopila sp. IMCC35006]